jgi:hypothetical protein
MYDYITKLCMKQAGVIQNHLNPYVLATGREEKMNRKHKPYKLGGRSAVLTAVQE